MTARLRRDFLQLGQRSSTLTYALENRGKFGIYFKDDDAAYYNEDNAGVEKRLSASLDVVDDDGVVDIEAGYPIRVSNALLRDEGSDVISVGAAPGADARKWFSVASYSGGWGVTNIGAPTETAAGGTSSQFDTETHYRQLVSGAAAGNVGGINGASINHFRAQHDPFMTFRVKPVTNTSVRYWIGGFSAAPGNVATLGSVQAFGFKWFNGDTNWSLVTSNGTTTTYTDTGVAFAANADFVLRCWLYGSTAYAQVNNGAVVSTGTTLPAAATELTYYARCVTTTTAGATIKIGSVWVDLS